MSFRATDTFDPDLFAKLSEVEDRYFWFVARNHLIGTLVSRTVRALPNGYRMLEIGCGTGGALRAAQRACDRGVTFGTDLFLEGLKFAAGRTSSPLLVSEIQSLPFSRAFHLVSLLDVLEHLDDDVAALEKASQVLLPGGAVVVTVPAHQWLWSYADTAAHHRRRYSARSLRKLLENAGFEVEFVSYFMLGTLPAVWLTRKLFPQKSGVTAAQEFLAELSIGSVTNTLLRTLVGWEAAWVGRYRRLPTGSSLVAIARLPGTANKQ